MTQDPLKILEQHWGFEQFRGSQEGIIESVVRNDDVLALLPTAGGKSICYQIPALIREGICIVVSPLVALIQDQVNQLKKRGIKAIALTGGLSKDELDKQLDNCLYGKYKFLYLSPERLQQSIVRERISRMQVNLIAIDEAHCISQWGHDFRPAYLECAILRDLKPEVNVIALTATATQRVVSDITSNLNFRNTAVYKDSFLRKNIRYQVVHDENKLMRLRELCSKIGKSGIVYVRTRRKAVEISQYLNKNKISADYFHGGIPREEKEKKLNSWLKNSSKIMVATNAFGMGVDKPDVELVLHYQIPDCIENYYQEAGRAGRDGSAASAILITNRNDEVKAREQFLDTLPNTDFLRMLYKKLNNYFQIPYGEGKEETYRLNFNQFCEIYKLNSAMAFNGLRILDQYSVLSLSQSFKRRTQLQFIVGKPGLMDYLKKNENAVILVQNILRTYGGVFDFNTKINTNLIAKKSGVEESAVLNLLEQLEKDNIIAYEAGHQDLELTFLVPREDDQTIYAFSAQLKELQRLKVEKLEAMLLYVKSSRLCRNKQLLYYFGESRKDDCGICDVCRAKISEPVQSVKQVERDILGLLASGRRTSRQLIRLLPYREKDILKMLQRLLEEDLIEINSRNEYVKLS